MQTFQLKINMSSLKHQIEKDYFSYRDMFFKCLAVNLCVYNQLYKNILSNTVLEDKHYHDFLQYLINKGGGLHDLVNEIGGPHSLTMYLDTVGYLDEFIASKHRSNRLNVYNLTIDEMYNVSVTNKQLQLYVQ